MIRRLLEYKKERSGSSNEFRYRFLWASHDTAVGSSGDNSSAGYSHPSRHNRHKLGHQVGSWDNRRLTLKTRIISLVSVGAVLAGGVLSAPPAFAVDDTLDLDTYQNTTGIDSPYFEDKRFYVNRYDDFDLTVADGAGGVSVSSSKPARVQWACPEVVEHFTDCNLYITVVAPEHSKKVQMNGDNNIYSPSYGVADKVNYWVTLMPILSTTGLFPGNTPFLRVPLLYDETGKFLVSRIDWGALYVNSMNISGQCSVLRSPPSVDDCLFQSRDSLNPVTGILDYELAVENSSILYAVSVQGRPLGQGPNFGFNSTYNGSWRGSTFKEFFTEYPNVEGFNLALDATLYSDFSKLKYSFMDRYIACIFSQQSCDGEPVPGGEGLAIEPYAYPSSLAVGLPVNSAGLSLFPTGNSGGTGAGRSNFDPDGLVQFPYKNRENLRFLFGFALGSPSRPVSNWNEACISMSLRFDCSSAVDYLSEVGNTTDEEGLNCISDCLTNPVNVIKYGNNQYTIDPYTNPSERPTLDECMSFVPVKFDWDCITLSLFAPDMGMITGRLSEFGAPLEQVLFPLSYALEFVSTGTGMLNLLNSDTCTPVKVTFPLIGSTTVLPCPADSSAFAQLASITRVLVPFIIFASVGVMFVRRLMARFGFAGRDPNLSDSSFSVNATTPVADTIHETGRNISSLTDPNSLVNKQLGGKR